MKKSLYEASIEELEDELRIRHLPPPKMVEHPDLSVVKKHCEGHMDNLEHDRRPEESFSHYLYEAVMEAYYGKDVWEWINTRRK